MSFEVIDRERWGARYGRGNTMSAGSKAHAVVHHDGHNRSKAGMSIDEESEIMRVFENYHVNGEPGVPGLTRANPRIAYNWVVMQTGRIYEGIGWARVGAHTVGLNTRGHAWCFPIHGGQTKPTKEAIDAFRWHVAEGIRLGFITDPPIISGHQDHGKPTCPGALLYRAAVTDYRPWEAVAAPRIVYSPQLGDYLVVTRHKSDTDWSFVPVKKLPKGTKAGTPLSRMPAHP